LFTAYLIAAELVMEPEKVLTVVGSGQTIHMSMNPADIMPSNTSQIFPVTLGSGFSCKGCIGLPVDGTLHVPVTAHLVQVSETELNLNQYFLGNTQDILSLRTQCYSLITPSAPLSTNEKFFRVINSISGVNFTQADVEIISRKASTFYGKRCRILIGEYRGMVKSRFSIRSGVPIQEAVQSIEADPSVPCTQVGTRCFNRAKRSQLSRILLNAAFSTTSATVERTKYLPDPSVTQSDNAFQYEMNSFVGLLLYNSASMFLTTQNEGILYTNTKALNLQVQPILQFTTIALCMFCLSLACMQIAFDLIQLGKASNELLRKVHLVVKPGQQNLLSIAQFSKETIDSAAVMDEWDYVGVKFGEDRKTANSPLGILRFGTRRDIVKFKDDRAYY
jgi:hypothetical protein